MILRYSPLVLECTPVLELSWPTTPTRGFQGLFDLSAASHSGIGNERALPSLDALLGHKESHSSLIARDDSPPIPAMPTSWVGSYDFGSTI